MKSLLYILLLFLPFVGAAQNMSINADGTAPDASSMLDVSDTTRGMLIPRMTITQRDAIVNPATGLLIFQTNSDSGFYFNQGTPGTPAWLRIQTSNDSIHWQKKDTNLYYLDGNVGIGLDVPQSVLHLYGKGSLGAGSRIVFGDDYRSTTNQWNTFIGESGWDDLTDSDQLQMHGRQGHYFTTGSPSATLDTSMFILSNGNVGIGNVSLAQKFGIYTESTTNNLLRMQADSGQIGLWFTNDSANWALFSDQAASSLIPQGSFGIYGGKVGEANAVRMVIDNNGQVGFGNTAPEDALQVGSFSTAQNQFLSLKTSGGNLYKSGIRLLNFADDDGFTLVSDETANRFYIQRHSGDTTTAFSIDRLTGDIGIGIDAPALQLSIGPADDDTGFETNSDGTLSTFTNGTERMRVTSAGRVGIGETIPNALLTLTNSGGSLNSGLQLSDGSSNDWYIYQNGSQELVIRDDGTDRLILDASGNLVPATDNFYDLGSASLRWDDVYATNGSIQTSDIRFKTNIKPLNYGLKEVLSINPIAYNWKDKPQSDLKLGLSAQELLQIIPEVVKTHDWEKDPNGELVKKELDKYGVYYTDLIPVLINAIKEQQLTIDQQNQNNEKQQYEIDALKDEVELLKKLIKNGK